MAVFGRQLAHGSCRHIRRVGEDQVEAPLQSIEEIGPHQANAAARRVLAGDRQRGCRNIGGRYTRVRKCLRRENREATRSGAEVQHRTRPRKIREQEGDVRARHDDTLVDVEALPVEPRFVQQIGDRDAAADPALDQ
jgi:hypothetical protein